MREADFVMTLDDEGDQFSVHSDVSDAENEPSDEVLL